MGSSALLKPFMEEWDGPLPQGFQAIAVAKGIALQQPFSLAPAVLHDMRQRLRHTSLAAALQASCIVACYSNCIACMHLLLQLMRTAFNSLICVC